MPEAEGRPRKRGPELRGREGGLKGVALCHAVGVAQYGLI